MKEPTTMVIEIDEESYKEAEEKLLRLHEIALSIKPPGEPHVVGRDLKELYAVTVDCDRVRTALSILATVKMAPNRIADVMKILGSVEADLASLRRAPGDDITQACDACRYACDGFDKYCRNCGNLL